jgi:hypothetical protein
MVEDAPGLYPPRSVLRFPFPVACKSYCMLRPRDNTTPACKKHSCISRIVKIILTIHWSNGPFQGGGTPALAALASRSAKSSVRHWLAVALLDPNPHHIAFQHVDSESHVDKHGKCLRQSIITVGPPHIHWDVRFCLFQALLPVHQRTIRPISHETAHVWLNIREALLSAIEPPSCVPDWFLQVPLNVANRR